MPFWQYANRLQRRFSQRAACFLKNDAFSGFLYRKSLFNRLPAFQKFRIELPSLVCYAKYSAIIIPNNKDTNQARLWLAKKESEHYAD